METITRFATVPSSSGVSPTKTWSHLLADRKTSGAPFSPTHAVTTLNVFADAYAAESRNRQVRRGMVNDSQFIGLLSECMKEIHLFGSSDLASMLHILVRRVGWKDLSLLKLLEGTIVDRLPSMDPISTIKILESYTGMRCGSRTFWEALVSSIISLPDRTELNHSDIIRIIRCVADSSDSKCLYKPVLILQTYLPLLEGCMDSMSQRELAMIANAYTEWPKGAFSQSTLIDLLNGVMRRYVSFSQSMLDVVPASSILQSVVGVYRFPETAELGFFLQYIQRQVMDASPPVDAPRTYINGLCSLVHGVHKLDSNPSREFFTTVESILAPNMMKVSHPLLPTLAQVYSNRFGLVHSYKSCPENMGPPGSMLWTPINDFCVSKALPRMNVRELARLGEGFASDRRGDKLFWASWATCFEKSLKTGNGSELAPEEIQKVVFAITEMDIGISEETLNELSMIVFEKIHLMANYINYLIFFFARFRREDLIGKLLELAEVDVMESHGAVVLSRLVLGGEFFSKEVSEDLIMYQRNCIEVVSPEIVEDVKRVVTGMCQSDAEGTVMSEVVIADTIVTHVADFDSKTAYVVISPLYETFEDKRLAGTMQLMIRTANGYGWKLVPISASKWVDARREEEKELIVKEAIVVTDRLNWDTINENPVDSTSISDIPETLMEQPDLTPYVRKDRAAAHRNRAPPSTELPWVSSVVSLKKPASRRKKNRNRNS